MRTLKTFYPYGLNIGSDYQQSFQTYIYFYCYIWLSQYQSTFLSNCYCFVGFFLVFFIWPHKLRTRLLCYSQTLVMYPVFSLGPLQASKKIFGSFTCYLQSQVVTCYVLSGFRNSSLISIHIIQLSLLLSFSKYIRFRQSYEFPFILRDLRHIYQCVLRQLRTKSKTKAMIARCKFIDCVVGRKFS